MKRVNHIVVGGNDAAGKAQAQHLLGLGSQECFQTQKVPNGLQRCAPPRFHEQIRVHERQIEPVRQSLADSGFACGGHADENDVFFHEGLWANAAFQQPFSARFVYGFS